jgi:hypothetical protein
MRYRARLQGWLLLCPETFSNFELSNVTQMTCPRWAPALVLLAVVRLPAQVIPSDALPDSPGSLVLGSSSQPQTSTIPCSNPTSSDSPQILTQPPSLSGMPCPRIKPENPLSPFVSTPVKPLTPRQKAHLAVHDVIDPFNILTIVANAGFTIGIDSHTAYGPGLKGFGRNIGVTFVEDATGEAIGTYAVRSSTRIPATSACRRPNRCAASATCSPMWSWPRATTAAPCSTSKT